MADLLNPTLDIAIRAGESNADVTATVNVTLTPFQRRSTRGEDAAVFTLEAKLFGDDGQLRGGDNERYTFPAQTYNADQTTYTFKQTLGFATLNEDSGLFAAGDELYVNFYLRSTDFPVNLAISSPVYNGDFG